MSVFRGGTMFGRLLKFAIQYGEVTEAEFAIATVLP